MRDEIRDALRWPLHSPRRLAAVVLAVVVLLVLIGSCNRQQTTTQGAAVPGRGPAAPAPAGPSGSAAPGKAPDQAAALETARRFVDVWASQNTDQAAWLNALTPLTTDRLLGKLATTDPRRVPAVRAGTAKITDTGGGQLTSVAVTTTAGAVSVRMLWAGDRWLVGDVQPGAQAAQ
ncbi:hypothetical protein [Streptomyces albireticuli]|uniref:Uncharacterized protein n=1 Tax=Streptomyces albireticuli TaxID=1940 RepID=A0A2A2DA31_9ACTN|nr:hypothetical protein [Streptomyces albireticuli]MCD9145862.1 hypothetical protein [Streptomyces albireticuli]MCD9166296.1 hypothetical protein [Streptomyces albireticuli]MCD9196621.1 hypothetical protein [Streptomyces albireticuli]PAU49343.1 hypothetical protein CK936_08385 [Streptomyces albireticuli]